MFLAPQSTTLRVALKAFLSSDHVSAATGKTIAVVISKNGAAFGNPSAGATNATEIGSGWYYVDLSVTDTGSLGPLIVRGTSATVDDVEIVFDVVDAAKGITSNLDAAVSSRSTYAGADTAGTTTLLTRLSSTRAGLLDNMDATVSSRSTYAGADTAGTTTLLGRLTSTRAGLLDNLDATVSSRSTYAGVDTAGTTTLLTRLSATRAGLLDNLTNLDAAISGLVAGIWSYATRTLSAFGFNVNTNANATETAIKAKTDNLPAAPSAVSDVPTVGAIAAQITTDHGAGSYVRNTEPIAPDNASIATILSRTDVATSTRSSHSAADVWAVTTRTLSSFGTLIADFWSYATRTLTAFGFTVNTNANATETAIKAKTDNLPAAPAAVSDIPTVGAIAAQITTDHGAGSYVDTGSGGGSAGPTAEEIAAAVWEESLSDHTTAGTAGKTLAAAGNAGDPWSTLLPGDYDDHTAGKIISLIDKITPSVPVVVVPQPSAPDQCTGYTTTRDARGAIDATVSIIFQLIAAPGSDSYEDASFILTSDAEGTLSGAFKRGAKYRARRGTGNQPGIVFTVPVDPDVTTFALPQVLGAP